MDADFVPSEVHSKQNENECDFSEPAVKPQEQGNTTPTHAYNLSMEIENNYHDDTNNKKILQNNQIATLKNNFLNRARDNTFFNALVSADKGYTPLNLSDNIISDIAEPNIPDTITNIKHKSLHGRYFKELKQPGIKYSP
jgi:hypothetical protein